MKWILLCHLIYIIINLIKGDQTDFTYTYKMAMLCKEHICQHGYTYETIYRVDANDLMSVKSDPHTQFEMHIAIQAASNGHILLSEVASPTSNDAVYEIVVGGGGNKFTELRRNLKRNAKRSIKTPGILSSINLRGFYIKISVDGLIEFGREGEVLPLISFNDIDPLQIKYFSFAAWNGVEAKFLYDCPIPGDNVTDSSSPDSQPEETQLSNSDELKRTLLMARLPSVPPSPSMNVSLGVRVTHVQYDAFESKLVTRMAVVMSWNDDSMAWNPDKFNGITNLKFRQGQIWRPTFYVLNSDSIGVFDVLNPDLISMVHSGEATFHFQTKIQTLCTDFTATLSKWPRDEYTCVIVIQPWEAHEKINITIMDPSDMKMKVFADIDEFILNEWEVATKQVVIEPDLWNTVYVVDDNQTHQSDRLIITIHLKRQATAYNIAFYTPLLVLTTFVLMSFWSEPLAMSRIWFYTGCTIFICTGLCYIDNLVPCHTVPSILVLYITVLAGVLVALLIHVALMSDLMEKICKTITMQTILTSMVLRALCCLPPVKISINGGYTPQEDDDDADVILPGGCNVEEMERENNNNYGNRTELAIIMDRLMFFVYSLTFAWMLAAHY